jgi:hypothetical protein
VDESQSPADEPTTPVVTNDEPTTEAPAEVETNTQSTPPETVEAPALTEASPEAEEDDEYRYQRVSPVPPLDMSQIATTEDGMIDPNALAGSINQRIAMAEANATARAQQIYAEQRAEEKQWDKAYDKYPELKDNKELRDLVYRTRIGEATDLLSRTDDPSKVRLPSPSQVADKLFKYIGQAKTEGMKQATQNTVVQQSAYVESSTKRSDDNADAITQLRQNINNPNKQLATQARSELLKKFVFGEE